jgi:tetratricopeptide (TPR) repeat protein
MLTMGMVETVPHLEALLDNALQHSADDPLVRAEALSQQSMIAAGMKVVDIPSALRSGQEAVSLDPNAGGGMAWASALQGLPFDVPDEVGRAGSDDPKIAAAMRHSWRGEVRPAREILGQEMAAADREGRSLDYANHQMHLGEVFVRSGDLDTAAAVLGLWSSSVEAEALESPDDERLRALMAALRGDVAEVERWAPVAFSGADRVGDNWSRLEAYRALALAAAVQGDLEGVVEKCQYVWEWVDREGVREVGAFPVAGELVEALIGLGRVHEAQVVTERLRVLSDEQSHPWGLATSNRCEAIIALSFESSEPDVELARLQTAAATYAELGLTTDEARTLLLLGSQLCRIGRLDEAETVLLAAAERFTAMGADAWVQRVHHVLDGQLTHLPAP